MLLINIRKFKLKWQLLILALPVLLLPVFLLIILYFGLHVFFEKEKLVNTGSLIFELSKNIDKEFTSDNIDQTSDAGAANENQGKIENIVFQENNLYKKGLIYVFNKDFAVIYTNITLMQQIWNYKINEKIFLENLKYKQAFEKGNEKDFIKTPSNSLVYKIKNNGINYYAFIFDGINDKFASELKFLYFYPEPEIFYSILPIILWLFFLSIIIIVVILISFIKYSDFIISPVNNLKYATKKASLGYLNINLISEADDEIGNIFTNLKDMINSYKDAVSKVSRYSQNMSGFQQSFNKITNSFEESLKNQLKFSSGNINVFGELNNLMLKSMQNIKDGQNIIKQAEINSVNSTAMVNDMVSEINKIAEASKEISFIIELINGISEKTRLLSVNSAIEASRAGEAGKGFAVVATEIRKLAMQTKEASSNISELIKTNEATINSGVNKTYEVISSLKNIDSSIKFMNSIMDRLNSSVQDGRKKAFDVMNINKNFSSSTTENFNFVNTLNKYKILLNSELDKIDETISKFILDIKFRKL